MKKSVKALSTIFLMLVAFYASLLTANAAENLKINSAAEVAVGESFTYSFYIDNCEEAIHGIQMHLYFNPNYLELDKESVKHDGLDEYVVDVTKNNNYYSMNWQGNTNGKLIDGKQSLVSLDFKVLNGGETNIEYFVQELFNFDVKDPDSHQLDSYTFTCDILKGDEKLAENLVPLVVSDQNVLNERQGEFINYKDGRGEKNHNESITDPQGSEVMHEPVTGLANSGIGNEVVAESSNNNMYIYIFAGIIILAVIGVLFIKLKNSKKLTETEEISNIDNKDK